VPKKPPLFPSGVESADSDPFDLDAGPISLMRALVSHFPAPMAVEFLEDSCWQEVGVHFRSTYSTIRFWVTGGTPGELRQAISRLRDAIREQGQPMLDLGEHLINWIIIMDGGRQPITVQATTTALADVERAAGAARARLKRAGYSQGPSLRLVPAREPIFDPQSAEDRQV
jgi:hypothetical protein